MPFTEIENAIAAIDRGELVVVVDDADRENEGDLIMAAEKVTPEAMAFMIRHTSGVICMPLEGERCDELAAPADGGAQHRDAAHRVHRLGRRPHRHHDRHLRGGPCRHGADARSTPRPDPTTSPDPATSSRCATARAACSSGPATPRLRSTSPASPGLYPAGVLAGGRERRRHDGPPARARAVRRRARAPADLDRRPHPVPSSPREAGAAGLRGAHPDEARRLHRVRVREPARRRRAHRVRARRGRGQRRRAGARALGVPHRRRVRFAALRLRRAARHRARAGRARGRGVVVYLRGHEGRGIGLGHKLRAYTLAGRGSRHGRGQRRARLPGRLPRVRDRRADPRRPRRHARCA